MDFPETTESLPRRRFLQSTAAVLGGTLAAPLVARHALAADTIKVGSLLDLSGPLGSSGQAMYDTIRIGVDEVNASGGLLGKQVQLINYDTQTNIQLYSQYAQKLALQDQVAVVHGGITSASREAIRPVFDRYKTLYFYNVLYEGGVCDRDIFCTGTTPAQTVNKLVPYALSSWGKKAYIIAADYNYGQITAKWVAHYVEARKGTVLATNFFPLDVSDFGSTIAKIQDAGPSFVVAALVGGAHMSFFRQWAASGMNKKIPLTSTTFGVGNEHLALSAAEGDGILIAGNYSPEIDSPANKKFLAAWAKKYGDAKLVHELAVSQYQGIMLWAEAVRKAGSIEREAVIKALETGLKIEGPAGIVAVDPKTHHCALDIHLMVVKDQKLTIIDTAPQRPPADTAQYCDLQKNPDDNTQYEVKI
jgi:urea transport system substrate-binding protein